MIDKAKKKERVVFQELLLKEEKSELYKLDLVFVKGDQALVADIKIRYESKLMSLANSAVEKVKKYQQLKDQIEELANDTNIKFIGHWCMWKMVSR